MKDHNLRNLLCLLFIGLYLAACGGAGEPQVFPPAAAIAIADTAVPPTEAPPTAAALPPTETAEPQRAADPERGREIFLNGGEDELYEPKYACSSCHTLDGSPGYDERDGPSLLGIAERAARRVPELGSEAYIRQSILDPSAYIAPTYSNKMNKVAGRLLSEEEMDDLVAFLLTLDSTDGAVAAPAEEAPDIEIDLGMAIAGDGNILLGRNAAVKYRCFGCHADENPEYGPPFSATEDLPHILDRGELRIADPAYEGQATTNWEFFIESIFIPGAYVLPGEWEEAMPPTFHERITDKERVDLLAWINSLE